MHTPFTYLIKHIPSGKVYYGLRYAKNCSPVDLWTTYFTSSKDIHLLLESDGKDSFAFEIRKVFNDAKKAIEWEKTVLRRMQVVRRNDFINRNIPGSSMFAHSEQTKEKMRKPKPPGFRKTLLGNQRATVLKGVPKTEEHSKNISLGKKGKSPFEGKNHPRQGVTLSESQKQKMSQAMKNKKWMNNGKESIFISSNDIDFYLKKGYTLGRGKIKK